MHKLLILIALVTATACTEEKKIEQVIIPEVQLEALNKAKNLEAELLNLQQQTEEKYKQQGL